MIYFIRGRESGRIKIGYTAGDPERRLAALQTGSSEVLELVVAVDGDQQRERALHRQLAAARLTGEWFSPTLEVLSMVDAAQAGQAALREREHMLALARAEAMAVARCRLEEKQVAERAAQLEEARQSDVAYLSKRRCSYGHTHRTAIALLRCEASRGGKHNFHPYHIPAERMQRARQIDRLQAQERAKYLAAHPEEARQLRKRQHRIIALSSAGVAAVLLAVAGTVLYFALRKPYRDMRTLASAIGAHEIHVEWSGSNVDSPEPTYISCAGILPTARVQLFDMDDPSLSMKLPVRQALPAPGPQADYVTCADDNGWTAYVACAIPDSGEPVCIANEAVYDIGCDYWAYTLCGAATKSSIAANWHYDVSLLHGGHSFRIERRKPFVEPL